MDVRWGIPPLGDSTTTNGKSSARARTSVPNLMGWQVQVGNHKSCLDDIA
jgi:hypothetical protein